MKVYCIGRDINCDIVINDSTDVVSRRHAVLHVSPLGKMTITDQSHNGTYVNGIRINPNVAVPITRKDNVSFAHVARLDWNIVPDPGRGIRILAFSAIGVLFILISIIFGIRPFISNEKEPTPTVISIDSIKPANKPAVNIDEKLKQKEDSIKKVLTDSISNAKEKALRDSISEIKKKSEEATRVKSVSGKDKKKNENKPKVDEKKNTDEDKQDSSFRRRG